MTTTTTRSARTRPALTRLAVLGTAALVLLAGCGSDDAGEPTSAPSEPTATVAPTEPVDAGSFEPSTTATVVAIGDSDLGPILVDRAGITLYVFDNDDVDTSACTGDCLAAWPPLEASEVEAGDRVDGELATFTRDDGTEQATINGAPLYYFANDAAPGDTAGQGVGGAWWVVDGTGTPVTGDAMATEGADGMATEGTDDGY